MDANRKDAITTADNVSRQAFKNTVQLYYELLGLDVRLTPPGSQEDVAELTDAFITNSTDSWRIQHKHGKGEDRDFAAIRYRRSSNYQTDYQKIQKLPYNILESLAFTYTFGYAGAPGTSFVQVPARSLLEWINAHENKDIDEYLRRYHDPSGHWSDIAYIPFAELSFVQRHKNYLESF